jgi:hypothetical protein
LMPQIVSAEVVTTRWGGMGEKSGCVRAGGGVELATPEKGDEAAEVEPPPRQGRSIAAGTGISRHYRCCFFPNYTYIIHRRHSQRTHTHPYEYTHANPTPRSIFEDCASKSSRLTKSPQTPRCRRERCLPLKAQTPLNPEKFASTGSRTQDLRCYRGSRNH